VTLPRHARTLTRARASPAGAGPFPAERRESSLVTLSWGSLGRLVPSSAAMKSPMGSSPSAPAAVGVSGRVL
jgi:hypothetical protein